MSNPEPKLEPKPEPKPKRAARKPRNPLAKRTFCKRTKRYRASLLSSLAFAEDRKACKNGTLGVASNGTVREGMMERWAAAPKIRH